MATVKQYEQLSPKVRQNRYFCESFKRQKVVELERNLITIPELI